MILLRESETVSIIRLGEHDLDNQNSLWRKDYDVDEFISHEGYDSNKKVNDIALIKLKTDVTISTKVRPACLHQNPTMRLLDHNVTAIGFGNTGYADDSSKVLLKVNMLVINPNLCRKWVHTNLVSSQLCIQGRGRADTCSGG